jgi:hypothetical protein
MRVLGKWNNMKNSMNVWICSNVVLAHIDQQGLSTDLKWHFYSQHHHILKSIHKAAPPPPTDISWSMNDGRVSAVGWCWLKYQSQNILTVGWGINYVSHHLSICGPKVFVQLLEQLVPTLAPEYLHESQHQAHYKWRRDQGYCMVYY